MVRYSTDENVNERWNDPGWRPMTQMTLYLCQDTFDTGCVTRWQHSSSKMTNHAVRYSTAPSRLQRVLWLCVPCAISGDFPIQRITLPPINRRFWLYLYKAAWSNGGDGPCRRLSRVSGCRCGLQIVGLLPVCYSVRRKGDLTPKCLRVEDAKGCLFTVFSKDKPLLLWPQ